MAVEQGFCNLINAGLAVSLPNLTGAFAINLPQNFISSANPWSWCFRSILMQPLYVLNGEDALNSWQVQVDCHGFSMSNALQVSKAIISTLSGGWSGTMTDVEFTVCAGIFRLPTYVSGYNPDSRSFVQSIEYEIHFYIE